MDITVYYDGHHGDLNETLFVGTVSESRKHLVKTAYECMMKGIEMGKLPVCQFKVSKYIPTNILVKPGVRYRDIGQVIQHHAQQHGYSVVRTYCGHGIHRYVMFLGSICYCCTIDYSTLLQMCLIMPVRVLLSSFYFFKFILISENKAIGVMKPGNTFTIEPMISVGKLVIFIFNLRSYITVIV